MSLCAWKKLQDSPTICLHRLSLKAAFKREEVDDERNGILLYVTAVKEGRKA